MANIPSRNLPPDASQWGRWVEDQFRKINTLLSKVDTNTISVQKQLSATARGSSSLHETVDGLRTEVQQKYDNAQVDATEANLLIEETKVGLAEAKEQLDNFSEEFDGIADGLNVRLNEAEQEIEAAEGRLSVAEQDLLDSADRIDAAEGRIDTVENTTLPALAGDLAGLGSDLDTLEGVVGPLPGKVEDAQDAAESAAAAAIAAEARATEANNRAMTRLANGNFEDGLKYWDSENASLTNDSHSGVQAVNLVTGGRVSPETAMPVVEGQIWEAQVYFKQLSAHTSTGLMYQAGIPANLNNGPFVRTESMRGAIGQWSNSGAIRLTVPEDMDQLTFRVVVPWAESASFIVDDIVLRDVTDVVRLEEAANSARERADSAHDRADALDGLVGTLRTDLDTAAGRIDTVQDVTLPALAGDLSDLGGTMSDLEGVVGPLPDAVAAAQDAADAAQAEAEAAEQRALSRGTDLVTNGTGYMGDNTNFSSFTYNVDGAPGSQGAFDSSDGYQSTQTDEDISVNPNDSYVLRAMVKQRNPNVPLARFYFGLAPRDAQGNGVSPINYAHDMRANTTLAQPLNYGDSSAVLTSTEHWRSDSAYLAVWEWEDPDGRVWPISTYTRNCTRYSSIVGDTVNFTNPYNGPSLPAGHPVGNTLAGGTYLYVAASNRTPTLEWSEFSGTVSGMHGPDANGYVTTATTKLPQGTASVRLLFLLNYSSGTYPAGEISTISFSNVSFSNVTAAAKEAEAARDAADAAQAKADAIEGTVGTLQTDLDAAEAAVATVRDVTLPALDGRLEDAEYDVKHISGEWITAGTVDTNRLNATSIAAAVATVIELNADRITAGLIQGDQINATSIAAAVASVIELNAGRITTGELGADRIAVNELAVEIADVIQLNAGRITSGEINTARLDAEAVAAAVGTFLELNAGQITAGEIGADRIAVNELSAAIATVIELNAGRITSGTIDTARLNAEEIAAAVGSFVEADVGNLVVTDGATMNEAVIEYLFTNVVAAKKITTEMMLVGPGENLVVNPSFLEDSDGVVYGWSTSGGARFIAGIGKGGGGGARVGGTSTTTEYVDGLIPDISPEESYRLRVWAKPTGTSAVTNALYAHITFYNEAGSTVGVATASAPATESGVWQKVESIFTAPAGAHSARLRLRRTSFSIESVDFSYPSVVSATDASLMVDGAVTARALNVVPEGESAGGLELVPEGMSILVPAEDGGPASRAIQLRSDLEQALGFIQDGQYTFSVNQEGNLVAETGAFKDSLTIDGNEVVDLIDNKPRGIIAHSRNTHDALVGTSNARLLAVTFTTPTDNRKIRVAFRGHAGTANPRTYFQLRQSPGASVTEADPPQHSWYLSSRTSGQSESFEWSHIRAMNEWGWPYGAQVTLGVFVRSLDSGGVANFTSGNNQEMWVEDIGTGVNAVAHIPYVPSGGGGSGGGSDTGQPTTREYAQAFYSTWVQSFWKGNGGARYPYNPQAQQRGYTGHWSSANGVLSALWGFNRSAIMSFCSGAEMVSATLTLENQHTGTSAPLTMELWTARADSRPNNYSQRGKLGEPTFTRGQRREMGVDAAMAELKNGNTSAFGIHPVGWNTSSQHYGYFATQARLIITVRK